MHSVAKISRRIQPLLKHNTIAFHKPSILYKSLSQNNITISRPISFNFSKLKLNDISKKINFSKIHAENITKAKDVGKSILGFTKAKDVGKSILEFIKNYNYSNLLTRINDFKSIDIKKHCEVIDKYMDMVDKRINGPITMYDKFKLLVAVMLLIILAPILPLLVTIVSTVIKIVYSIILIFLDIIKFIISLFK
jgi:hypothetical protein